MSADPTIPKTALEELIRRSPAIDPVVLERARRAADMLRKLGLLSTEPAEAFRPFGRPPKKVGELPPAANNWAAPRDIQFSKDQ